MPDRIFSGILMALLLIGMLTLTFRIQPVKAQPATIIVPDDYPTIQAAINAAKDGDTVYVKSGVYQQVNYQIGVPDIQINKSISLIGQDKETTIISDVYWFPYPHPMPQPANHIIRINADNVTIEGFTFQYGSIGCWVCGSGCLISGNKFISDEDGVALEADGNTVSNCFFNGSTDCSIVIIGSSNNTVTSNVVQETVSADTGGIFLFSFASNNTIVGNEVNDCVDYGIIVGDFCTNNTVAQNDITNNGWGKGLWNGGIVVANFADSNEIVENNVSNNKYGLVQRLSSSNNSIYHNSFIDNQVQVIDFDVNLGACVNFWDNGYPSGGNYWSNYGGTDSYHGPYQNITGSDGIGDTQYVVDANNTDHYPLMQPGNSQITFDQTGLGSNCNGTVVTIDGLNYTAGCLPLSFWWGTGSVHSYSYAPSVVVSSGEQYFWNSTTGLSTLQTGSITVAAPGSVTGDYVTHEVIVTNITASAAWVYQGGTLTINVTVKNVGDFNESAVSVTLYYDLKAGKSINTYPLTLEVGQSLTFTFTWDTTGVPCQNYTLTAVATIPTGSNALSDGNITIKLMGDVNGDGRVDLRDLALAVRAFGSAPSGPNWNPFADVNGDGKVDLKDVALIARNFGQHYP